MVTGNESINEVLGLVTGNDYVNAVTGIASGLAFIIEFWTYTLYFCEEGAVILLRCISDAVYSKDFDLAKQYFNLEGDSVIKEFETLLAGQGRCAVYCYNAFASYCFVLHMWKEYVDIKKGGGWETYQEPHRFEAQPTDTDVEGGGAY